VKINSLNAFFAQRHKADVGHNLVVLPIRMFHYCSLLLDFDKFWYRSSIIKLECDVINVLGADFSEMLVSMHHTAGCYTF
jgi:hypothetical protein